MKETVNSWLVESTPYAINRIRYKKRTNDDDFSGFRVRYCTKCKRAHENAYYAGEGSSIFYYSDFPTYGLKREICKYCGELRVHGDNKTFSTGKEGLTEKT